MEYKSIDNIFGRELTINLPKCGDERNIIENYSSLTLVLAFCKGSHIFHKNKFSSILTLYIVPHIPKASGICEKKFQRFSLKNL